MSADKPAARWDIPAAEWADSPYKDARGDSVTRYTPLSLVVRAVRGAKPREPGRWPRWVAVKDVFGLGSTFSAELCRLAGLDPDELVDGPVCEQCAELAAASKPDVIGPDCDYPLCGCSPADKCKEPLTRCESRGGSDARGGNFQCGLPAGHDEPHSALIPTGAPWFGRKG